MHAYSIPMHAYTYASLHLCMRPNEGLVHPRTRVAAMITLILTLTHTLTLTLILTLTLTLTLTQPEPEPEPEP